MSSRSRGLPRSQDRAFGRALDTLTDPGAGHQDTSDTPDNQDTSVASVTGTTSGNSGTASRTDANGGADDRVLAASDAAGAADKPKPAPRQHVKLRGDLADQMRDAVWFFSEHGRPRVQLGELLDEAMEAWLSEAKARHNDGRNFPRRGRLR